MIHREEEPAYKTTGVQPLIGHGVLAVNNSWMTVLKMLVTVKRPPITLTHLLQNDQYLNSPYEAILHRKTTKIYMWYRLHMLMLSKSEAEISNSLKLL